MTHTVTGDPIPHDGPPEACTWPGCPAARTPDQMCTCGHGAASAHDIHVSIPAFTACVVTGCTCKAFTAADTPDADNAARRARREALLNLVSRAQYGKILTPAEGALLRDGVEAEMAIANDAREVADVRKAQRDTAASALADLRNDLYAERAAHEEHRRSLALLHDLPAESDWLAVTRAAVATRRGEAETQQRRRALADALGCPNTATWQHLTVYARQTQVSINSLESRIETERCRQDAALRGEAEAVRAREAGEAEVKRLGLMVDEYSAGAQQLSDKLRAAQADAEARRRAIRPLRRDERTQRERADRAEATLTAVREAVAVTRRHANPLEPACFQCGTYHLAAIEAALGDPQPAAEPEAEREHGWAPATCRRMDTRTCPPSGPCPGPCARFESDDPTPWEQPAEPVTGVAVATDSAGTIFTLPGGIKPAEPQRTISVLDEFVTALAAAGRRLLRGDTQ